MTHSHDTSTPAMSAETVPSEEFVLVPREPTEAMLDAFWLYSGESNLMRLRTLDRARSYFHAMIAAAPTLSASHLAKEGGEAGAVERHQNKRRNQIINRYCSKLSDIILNHDPEVHHLGNRVWDCLDRMVAECEALASLPQPSPALAKGGDAVRLLPCPFCGGEPTLHPHSPDHMLGAWVSCSTCGLESPTETGRSVEAAVQHWNTRAALSTPTEGPASQTEGMGRDATKLRENIEAFLEMHRRGVLTPRTPNIPIELLQKALAALTQPETAEAVPPLYLIRKGGAFYRPNSQGYTRSIAEAGRYSLAEAEAITHPNGPNGPRDGMDYIPAPALASDPAPATDDRERLVEASDKLVSIVEGIQGIEFGTFRAERNRVRLKDTKEWVEFYLALTRVHAALATEARR